MDVLPSSVTIWLKFDEVRKKSEKRGRGSWWCFKGTQALKDDLCFVSCAVAQAYEPGSGVYGAFFTREKENLFDLSEVL